MAKKGPIRDLEDLTNRVAVDLPLDKDIRAEAVNQLRFLKEKTGPVKISSSTIVLREDLDYFRELETVVQKAEQYDLPNFNEVKVEFHSLIMQYRSAGRPLYQRKQNLISTMPAKPMKSTIPILENENEMREKILTLRHPKGNPRPSLDVERFSPEMSNRSVSHDRDEEYMRLKKSEEVLKAQVEELTTRLSKFASEKLVDQNPNIADLSDKNRPTKLGERFGELYDNEWADAFEELKRLGKEEHEVISVLLTTVELIQWMLSEIADQQLIRLERYMKIPLTEIKWTVKEQNEAAKYVVERDPEDLAVFSKVSRTAKELRKSSALASVPSLCVLFKDSVFRAEFTLDYNKLTNLEKYIEECVKCVWLMCVQDPPIRLVFQKKKEQVDLEKFRFYERKGKEVDQCVWPAVLLHQGGPLVSKGYVLPSA